VKLLYAELLKVRTAPRTTVGLTLGLLGLVGLGAGATASDAGGDFREEMVAWDVLGVASTAAIFTLILGILVVTWEYRHGTITQTYLATPRRERVIGVKLAVSFLLGAVLAALAIAVALVVARFWLSYELQAGQWELAGRIVLGAALWGVFGAGLGALLQSQVGAIITSFVWFLVAEPLVAWRLESVGDYLPGNALDRLQNQDVAEAAAGGVIIDQHPYSLFVAGLLAAGYAAGLGLAGVVSAQRRDVP
jgi:ABC-2 type transport system permease protein